LSPALLDFIGLVLLCAGIVIAAAAYRRSSALLAVLVCAATGLIISPISWDHHYVWIVPVVTWLLVGTDRPQRGEWWAGVAALAFFLNRPSLRGGSGWFLYLRDNPYLASTLMFVALIGVMLWARARSRRQAFAAPYGPVVTSLGDGRCADRATVGRGGRTAAGSATWSRRDRLGHTTP
jgi:hypothetical protein